MRPVNVSFLLFVGSVWENIFILPSDHPGKQEPDKDRKASNGLNIKPTVCIRYLDKLKLVKLAYGGLVLGSSQFFLLHQLFHKNNACCKRGQK